MSPSDRFSSEGGSQDGSKPTRPVGGPSGAGASGRDGCGRLAHREAWAAGQDVPDLAGDTGWTSKLLVRSAGCVWSCCPEVGTAPRPHSAPSTPPPTTPGAPGLVPSVPLDALPRPSPFGGLLLVRQCPTYRHPGSLLHLPGLPFSMWGGSHRPPPPSPSTLSLGLAHSGGTDGLSHRWL